MRVDSCLRDCEFESHHRILDGSFSNLFVVKMYWCWRRPKINKKEAGDGSLSIFYLQNRPFPTSCIFTYLPSYLHTFLPTYIHSYLSVAEEKECTQHSGPQYSAYSLRCARARCTCAAAA